MTSPYNVEEFCSHHPRTVLALGAAVAVLLRCFMGFSPYSGEGQPPMHGDFEAQRHWMEITTALPMTQWYENTTDNDLMYWGLDYPPLTAYHSFALGVLGHNLVPACFALHTSRGHESPACRLFMRASVICSDIAVYFPGVLCAVWGFSSKKETTCAQLTAVIALWMLPPLLVIDHGHFQYNGVCFGLCLGGAGLVASGQIRYGSVLFTAGLLYKQIALYYAPAFFFGILGVHMKRSPTFLSLFYNVAVTGFVVLFTVFLLFLPWICTPSPIAAAGQVIHRMFPFARGLYEDKVANVWCSTSVVLKLHHFFPQKRIPMVCAAVTLLTLLPTCAHCLRLNGRGGKGPFAAALTASAFAFFLFAFQVHEKSILFPCVAACLLPVAMGPEHRPSWVLGALGHFMLATLFSMYPLVVKDGMFWGYAVVCLALVCFCEAAPSTRILRTLYRISYVLAMVLHTIHAAVKPPSRYPDAWTLLITGSSCGYFVLCFVALTALQLQGAFDNEPSAVKLD